jgi:hypothetical protein
MKQLLLLSCLAFLNVNATQLQPGQCVGIPSNCIGLIEIGNGINPGALIATAQATVIDSEGINGTPPGTPVPIGTLYSAVFRESGADRFDFYYQLALGSSFPMGAQSLAIISLPVSQPSFFSIDASIRTDDLSAYGATGFSASSQIPYSIAFGAQLFQEFISVAFADCGPTSCPTGNPLLPGQTSSVIEVGSIPDFESESYSEVSSVPLGDGFAGHGYGIEGAILTGAPAPEPATFALLALGGLTAFAWTRKASE